MTKKMVSTIYQVKKGIYQRLANDPALFQKVTDVFSEPGRKPILPYVFVGNAVANSYSTKQTGGQEVTVTIHTWSGFAGDDEVLEIHPLILGALSEGIDVGDQYYVLLSDLESEQILRNPDRKTRQGILEINFTVMEV